MEDKRLTQRLTDYWNRLRKDAPMPPWERHNVGAIGDLWEQCCVWRAEVNDGTKSNIYINEHIGRNMKQVFGDDLTGEMVLANFRNFPGIKLIKNIDAVVENHQPAYAEGRFVNEDNKVVKYRSCMLPFGGRQGNVSHILLGLSWKAY